MQISISVRHGQLSEPSRERIEAKVGKVSKFFDRLTAIAVTVDLKDEEAPMVELLVSAEHKHDFVAREQGSNLIGAVESAVHKIEQQIKRYKDKIQDHRKPGVARLTEEVASQTTTETESETE